MNRKANIKSRAIKQNTKHTHLGNYLIYTNTKETEKNYLNGLVEYHYNSNEKIQIKYNKELNKLVELIKNEAQNNSQYSEKWLIFDKDQEDNFDNIINEAQNNDIKVAWSNPCIEIWFLAYYKEMKSISNSKLLISEFREIYQKKCNSEYKKDDVNIYNKLIKYGDEKEAIKRAENKLKNIEINTLPSTICPGTTMHLLVKELIGIL